MWPVGGALAASFIAQPVARVERSDTRRHANPQCKTPGEPGVDLKTSLNPNARRRANRQLPAAGSALTLALVGWTTPQPSTKRRERWWMKRASSTLQLSRLKPLPRFMWPVGGASAASFIAQPVAWVEHSDTRRHANPQCKTPGEPGVCLGATQRASIRKPTRGKCTCTVPARGSSRRRISDSVPANSSSPSTASTP